MAVVVVVMQVDDVLETHLNSFGLQLDEIAVINTLHAVI